MHEFKKHREIKRGPYYTGYVSLIVISLLPLILAVLSLPFLPDTIPNHYGFNLDPTSYSSNYSVLIIPIISLILGLFSYGLCRLVRLLEEDEKVKTGEKAVLMFVIVMLAILLIAEIFILYSGFKYGY